MGDQFTLWCQLPPEIQTECIKWMDFKSRMKLRATSRAAKSLVELAPKFHYYQIELNVYDETVSSSFQVKNGEKTVSAPAGFSKKRTLAQGAYSMLIQVLKFAVVDSFMSFSPPTKENDDVAVFLSEFSNCPPLRIRSFRISANFEVSKRFLEKCENVRSVSVQICGEFDENQFLELLGIDSFVKARVIRFESRHCDTADVQRLIQKWVENDGNIQKDFYCDTSDCKFLENMAMKLDNRVVFQSDTIMRLRTDNYSKHALIRHGISSRFSNSYYLSVTFASAASLDER